jgi:hypothetical protein
MLRKTLRFVIALFVMLILTNFCSYNIYICYLAPNFLKWLYLIALTPRSQLFLLYHHPKGSKGEPIVKKLVRNKIAETDGCAEICDLYSMLL